MDKKYFDLSVSPGDDFFKFCCGNWVKYHPQPNDYPSWNVFTVIEENNINKLKSIIDELSQDDMMQKKMIDYWNLMRDYDRRNSERFAPMKPYIDYLEELSTKDDILKFMISDMSVSFGISVLLGPDMKNSKMNEVIFTQSLPLDNREYYLSDDERNKSIIAKYKDVSINVLTACGYPKEQAKDIIDVFVNFNTELAHDCYDMEDLNKPELNYHKMSVDELSALCNYDIRKFLSWHGMNETDMVIVEQTEAIVKFFSLINNMTLDELRECVMFVIIDDCCCAQSEDFGNILFEFTKFMTGAIARPDKWKREVNKMNSVFSEQIGKLYAEKFFSGESKPKMIEIIKNIISSFREIIDTQSWMSYSTKKIAIEKLDSMTYKVGYPEKWEDYSDIPVEPEKSYLENCLAISKYYHRRFLEKNYNKPVDYDEWPMLPQSVNACYMPTRNEFCFPCGILVEPFFDVNADMAMNYGGIGVVIGHEITHGFDSSGRQFTKDGNIEDWWTASDAENFNKQTENTVKRFDSLYVLPDLKCNAELTKDENIADYGGLNIAYNALDKYMWDKKDIDDEYNYKQRFFISFATIWAGVCTDMLIRQNTMNGTHSMNFMRVNGTVPMMDEWYESFGIKEDSKLYVKPEDRGRIWNRYKFIKIA